MFHIGTVVCLLLSGIAVSCVLLPDCDVSVCQYTGCCKSYFLEHFNRLAVDCHPIRFQVFVDFIDCM